MTTKGVVQKRRETVIPDSAVCAAMGAIAAVIEETCCCVGPEQLRGLVSAHGRLCDAVGFERDYRYRDGVAFYTHGGAVIKDAGCGLSAEVS